MSIRIPITLVIEMSDRQLAAYVALAGLEPARGGHVPAKTIVGDVRERVLGLIRESAAFSGDGAAVSMKR